MENVMIVLTEATTRLVDKRAGDTKRSAKKLLTGSSKIHFEKLVAQWREDHPDGTDDDLKLALLVMVDMLAGKAEA